MSHTARLLLKPEPDGLGYIYGTYTDAGGKQHRIDILPPQTEPRPFWVPAEHHSRRHPTEWIIHIGGDEVARVSRADEIEPAIARIG